MGRFLHDLAGLVAPLTVDAFVREHWERRALYASGDPDRFRGFFDVEDFWRALGETRLGYGKRRVYVKAGHRLPNGDHREMPITAGQVPQALDAGLTVQAEWLDAVCEPLSRLLESVRRELGIAAEMDIGCFVSPDGSGYGAHYDATAMWTMQIAGQKLWRYAAEPSVAWPRTNFVPTAEDRASGRDGYAEDGLLAQVLSPGDVLYLPPGTWHMPKAIGTSVHLSLTVRASTPLTLFSSLFERELLEHPAWRHLPSSPRARGREGEEDAERELRARLAELKAAAAALSADDVVRAWRVRRGEGAEARDAGAGAPEALGGVEADDVLAVSEEPRFAFAMQPEEAGGPALLLVLGASVVGSLPASARDFVARMLEARRFTARTAARWDAAIDEAEVLALFGQLRAIGCLRRA